MFFDAQTNTSSSSITAPHKKTTNPNPPKTNTPNNNRLAQLIAWLAADGGDVLVVFDECHRAKNLVSKEGASTVTGLAVASLQEALPNARCVV